MTPLFSSDTIFALATPFGVSGVAVVRVSGPQALSGLETLTSQPSPAPRYVAVRRLRHPETQDVLDEALVLFFQAPKSFTGEDIVEYHLHGSMACVREMLAILATFPEYRLAEPGEFTRRAFLNGRLSVLEIEGLSDLLAATTQTQHRQAIAHFTREVGAVFEGWKAHLLRALAYVEAGIDFSEEADIATDLLSRVVEIVRFLLGEIARALATSGRGERVREGLLIVIGGPPNAGKSSLLNALAKRDVAMVSEKPGTTRDFLEISYDLRGLPCRVIDTAGLRAFTEDSLEEEGMRRARACLEKADLILWMEAPDARGSCPEAWKEKKGRVMPLWNKTDLASPPSPDYLGLSLRTSDGIEEVLDALGDALSEVIPVLEEPALVTRQRHVSALEDAQHHLNKALGWIAEGSEFPCLEVLAEHIRCSARALETLLGKCETEDVLGVIFQDFCIGK